MRSFLYYGGMNMSYDEIAVEIKGEFFTDEGLKRQVCEEFTEYLRKRFEKLFENNSFEEYLYENWDKIIKHFHKDDKDLFTLGIYNPIIRSNDFTSVLEK